MTAPLPRRLGLTTATLAVVANMIGTGVFTTTGLLVADLRSGGLVLAVWIAGGVLALCGALAYAELGARSGANGGEYRFLSDIFHPALGFVAGWISLVVGFSAPIAASALAFGRYVEALQPDLSATTSAVVLVVLLSALHSARVQAGARLQNAFTVGKVGLIAAFVIGAGLVGAPTEGLGAEPAAPAPSGGELAVALIFVSFAYSGWNGAAYLAGEVRDPARTLPRALVGGTVIVMVLYVALNAVFVLTVPPAEIAGKVEVGHAAAVYLFGPAAGRALSGLIALALVSSVSSMIMVGPRVYEAVGADHPGLGALAARGEKSGPVAATALQGVLAIAMGITASFETLLVFIGLTLSLSSALTVAGLFVDRRRHPEAERPYRAVGHPYTSGVFILFMLGIVVWSVSENPGAAAASAATIALGFAAYAAVRRLDQRRRSTPR